ncbi:hypothetical protein G7085_10235 [Tessaracoccus sp. HDW20]|uniref:hypothetical protein n=1 Tax=Tessaracoccus coleopterorum TaxID=2714950 RepID=UPI0018D2BD79|nr:hypothetical protein [Tessaracoccus coleopterorum]NHB84851.1 hypothetical protein [Tessaracoccus coleopterorum]
MNPRRLLRALMAALLVAVGLVAPPRSASADPGSPLEVRIGAVSTPVLNFSDPAQVVQISGTLTNTSTTRLTDLVVHFWRLPVPITSTKQLDALRADTPIGARVTDLTSLSEIDALGPGERAPFTVQASIAQLTSADDPLTRDGAVYLIGAQVRGSVTTSSGRSTVGADTFPIAATRLAVESSAVVSLTARPSWLPDGGFRDSSLADDLDGRLDILLSSGERPGIQVAIDPALYDAALRMSGPHVVAGEEVTGNGIALRWVQRVDALIAEGRVWRLPYGNPDLMRADASGLLQQTLASSRTAGAGILHDLRDAVILDGATGHVVAQLGEFDTVIVRDATGAEPGPPRILGAVASDKATSAPDGHELATLLSEDFLSPRPPLYIIDTVRSAEVDRDLAAWRTLVAPTATPAEPLAWEQQETAPWPEVAKALAEADADAALQGDLTGSPPPT